jgi:Domain of unknown function (DUF1905)
MVPRVDLEFSGELWRWEGPAPWHFVTVPEAQSDEIADAASAVTYGWGMVPVTVTVGTTTWSTSLWPHEGRYVVPVKQQVRRRERLELGDTVDVRLTV